MQVAADLEPKIYFTAQNCAIAKFLDEMCNWNKFVIKFFAVMCVGRVTVLGGKALSSLVFSLLNNASRKKVRII